MFVSCGLAGYIGELDMKKEYRVRYKKGDDFYGFVTTDGEDLTANHAKNRVIDFLEANGIVHLGIDEVYEVDSEGNRVLVEGKI